MYAGKSGSPHWKVVKDKRFESGAVAEKKKKKKK